MACDRRWTPRRAGRILGTALLAVLLGALPSTVGCVKRSPGPTPSVPTVRRAADRPPTSAPRTSATSGGAGDAVLRAISKEGTGLIDHAHASAALVAAFHPFPADISSVTIALVRHEAGQKSGKEEFTPGQVTTLKELVRACGKPEAKTQGGPVREAAPGVVETHWWGDVGVGVARDGNILEVGIRVPPPKLSTRQNGERR
jgi:hypothetical protein